MRGEEAKRLRTGEGRAELGYAFGLRWVFGSGKAGLRESGRVVPALTGGCAS